MRLIDKLHSLIASLRGRTATALPVELVPEVAPEPPKPKRERKPTPQRKRRTRRVRNADGVLVERPRQRRRKARKAAGGRRRADKPCEPTGSASARPPVPAPLPASKHVVRATPAPKPWTGEQFHDAAQAAKRAATAELGERWDLVPGASGRLIIPAKLRSFKTERGTRIRASGDRRYPAACFWPGGAFPPGCEPVAEYAWEQAARVVGRVSKARRIGGPAKPDLTLTPEEWRDAAD